MPTNSVAPSWLSRLLFTDPLRKPPSYRFDLVHAPGTIPQTVVMQRTALRLHSSLPVTEVWAYDGHYPAPTFVVNRKQVVEVTWVNGIHGAYPVRVVKAKEPKPGDTQPQNEPGDSPNSGGAPDVIAGMPPAAFAVVHLHGGRTPPDADGWPENVLMHGAETVFRYPIDQPATLLWYHDHAMGITRYNAFAGLSGLFVIRDEVEKNLRDNYGLPAEDDELFLLIQDRNLATCDNTADGDLTGQLLHKIDDGTNEFFGPFTLVNGTIWPTCSVRPRTYRVRVLNGSNARAYGLRLVFLDGANQPTDEPVPEGVLLQIGTDGGLLPIASAVPSGADIILAPAERADLLIDFGKLAHPSDVRRVAWFNTAAAPFDGTIVEPTAFDPAVAAAKGVPAAIEARQAERDVAFLRYPQVIRFDVASGAPDPAVTLPDRLVPDTDEYRRLARADVTPDPMGVRRFRLIALLELSPATGPKMLVLRELVPSAGGKHHRVGRGMSAHTKGTTAGGTYTLPMPDGTTTEYQIAAENFHDTVNWFVPYGNVEEWRFINLSPDTHPMHIHLVQFQVLDRTGFVLIDEKTGDTVLDPTTGSPAKIGDQTTPDGFPPAGFRIALDPANGQTPPIPDSADVGRKDTVRVNPNEMVAVAAKFDGYPGRYMYHCHVIEHEDFDMMRPFVVVPAGVMDMPHMGETGTHAAPPGLPQSGGAS